MYKNQEAPLVAKPAKVASYRTFLQIIELRRGNPGGAVFHNILSF